MSDSSSPRNLEGELVVPAGSRFAIVAARFNSFIVERLVEGAIDGIRRHGGSPENITVVRVPGAWEIGQACVWLAKSGKVDAVIALGAVIRGATAHFDFVAGEAARGVAAATATHDVPVAFGVLTTDTIEQAVERAGTKAGNKGFDAALTAIEMLNLRAALARAGF